MSRTTIRIPKKIMGKKLDGEWVFLNLENGVYYGLNETGSFIWDELKENTRPELISIKLQKQYGVRAEDAERDVRKLIEDLKREALIESDVVSSKT